MWGLSYWAVPIFSATVWLAMLLAMLVKWITDGSPHYPSMDAKQKIAYISDVGAQELKPLFIAMGAVTVVTFDLAFVLERWLRHTGRLAKNTSVWQKLLSIISIIAAIAGAAGLILLAIFDTLRHPRMHNGFLALFIVGYIVSAICICWEYQRLGYHWRENNVLKYSFYIKLFFIFVEIALAIAFGVLGRTHHYNTAAVIEWVIALVYFFYVLSFFIDFMPAVHTKHHQSRQTNIELADAEAAHRSHHDNGAVNGHRLDNADGYVNGHSNGYTNSHHHYKSPAGPIPASRNF